MVSTGLYLNIFSQVMPQRIERIRKVFTAKARLDLELKKCIKDKKSSTDIIIELQNLIGKDTLFRKAEKKKGSQTLRHYVWQSQKSLTSLNTYLEDYLKNANKEAMLELESNGILLGQTMETIKSISGRASDLVRTIDDLSVRESKSLQTLLEKLKFSETTYTLNEGDTVAYFGAVSNEWIALKALGDLFLSFKNALDTLQKSVSLYFREKNYKKRSADAPRIVQDVITIVSAIGFIVAIYIAYDTKSSNEIILNGFFESALARNIAVISTAVAVVARAVLPFISSPESKNMSRLLEIVDWTDGK